MKTKRTGFWIFFCNPTRWNIDDFLRSGITESTYLITKWQKNLFQIGDRGVIRVAKDKRRNCTKRLDAGIYAFIEIIGKPHLRGLRNSEYWNDDISQMKSRFAIDYRIDKNLLSKPILLKNLSREFEIRDEVIFNGGYGFNSSFPLSEESFNSFLNMRP